MRRYNPKEIEPKWQRIWDEQQTYKADLKSAKPKYYAMSMLNYPSGAGIHIGHAMNYTISDVLARFKRQQGYESYHPIGWDAFGLPAENYAIKSGVSPQASMAKIIPNYHKQYKAMGWSNDWSKEISTHEPEYYKWTQWIFSEMYRHSLVYQDSRLQWWCPIDNSVLADEQVTAEGKCWRHDGPDDPLAEKREIKQWFFKITDYADELLEAIEDLDWTESVKLAQKNWIGKSQGALIDFQVAGGEHKIQVFTTRPDTIFGATYLVLAPEHPLVKQLTASKHQLAVREYTELAVRKTELERQEGAKQKTGVFTGSYAINPANQAKIPIWIADYVLMGYGTGAIMAVPAHDERDWEFAKKFELPIQPVIEPVFIQTQEPGAVRTDMPFVEREAITAIVRHWSEDKYIGLKWKNVAWGTFITGGVEKGQTPKEAAIAEIIEETGYLHPVLRRTLSRTHAQFYHVPKKENRFAHFHTFYFELADDEQKKTAKKEQALHEIVWLNASEIKKFLTAESHLYVWDELQQGQQPYMTEGIVVNSGSYDGLDSAQAREKIVNDLSRDGVAQEQINYRMRDWSVSRQRYWGAPIPIINCKACGQVLVPDKDLPVILPELKDFAPKGDGRSALARAEEWLRVPCPKCGKPAERETDTMDTFVDSSWYFLRYLDPHNTKEMFDTTIVNRWMPVDFYNGADHATAHLIYARFVTRFFHKIGLVDNPEPFKKFLFNGKVTAPDGANFSKSKGNGVDPLEIIDSGYGADALRAYLMFAAPLDVWIRWDPQGVPGTYRFLNRVWELTQEFLAAKKDKGAKVPVGVVHRAIKKVTDDIQRQKYNTAIASMMQLVNELYKAKLETAVAQSPDWRFALESLIQLLAPFAPHISEELWHELGHKTSIHIDHWPIWDDDLIIEDTITLAVQINGKVRAEIVVPSDVSEKEAIESAKKEEKVAGLIKGKDIKKSLYVPGRLVSLVV